MVTSIPTIFILVGRGELNNSVIFFHIPTFGQKTLPSEPDYWSCRGTAAPVRELNIWKYWWLSGFSRKLSWALLSTPVILYTGMWHPHRSLQQHGVFKWSLSLITTNAACCFTLIFEWELLYSMAVVGLGNLFPTITLEKICQIN